jgi:RNA exonuclease 1
VLPSPGERVKTYTCCQRLSGESEPALLHARHKFSSSASSSAEAKAKAPLDVVALDCEMLYTTGGFRIARVSVVDGSGKSVFDECVKMDDGVEIVYVPPKSFQTKC